MGHADKNFFVNYTIKKTLDLKNEFSSETTVRKQELEASLV